MANSGQIKKREKHRLITLDMKRGIIMVFNHIQRIIEGYLKTYIQKNPDNLKGGDKSNTDDLPKSNQEDMNNFAD